MRSANRFGLFPLFALLCLLLLGMGRCVGPSQHRVRPMLSSYQNGTRFLFVDFDGDRIPDFAQVELQNRRYAKNNYSIHVKLSAGMESAIGVSGPDGGLRVAARDVNGDEALDLVLTSNLDSDFVEVLLNDGHGNFSVAKDNEFVRPENALGGGALSGPDEPQADRFSLVASRFSADLGLIESRSSDPGAVSSGYSTSVARVALCGSALRCGSRSPPTSIANS